MGYIASRQVNPFYKTHIFTNDFVQGVTLLVTITVGIGTIFYFLNEARSTKIEMAKNKIEMEKLKREILELEARKNSRRA